MRKDNQIYKGIVIDIGQYRDNDNIITVLAENQKHIIYVKSGGKITSKNRQALNLFSICTFETKYIGFSDKEFLVNAKQEEINFFDLNNDLKSNALKFFMSDLLKKLFLYDKFKYISLVKILQLIKEEYPVEYILLIFLRECYICLALKLNYFDCCICHSKTNLIAVSFKQGGIICSKCIKSLDTNLDYIIKDVTLLNLIYTNKTQALIMIEDNLEYTHLFIKKMLSNLLNNYQLSKLDSFEFLESICF